MKFFLFWLRRVGFSSAKSTLFYLLLLLLPFGRRKILTQYTGGFDEYEALFLYLSDAVLVLLLLFSFGDVWRFIKQHRHEAGVE